MTPSKVWSRPGSLFVGKLLFRKHVSQKIRDTLILTIVKKCRNITEVLTWHPTMATMQWHPTGYHVMVAYLPTYHVNLPESFRKKMAGCHQPWHHTMVAGLITPFVSRWGHCKKKSSNTFFAYKMCLFKLFLCIIAPWEVSAPLNFLSPCQILPPKF